MAKPKPSPSSRRRPRILCVDDEPQVLEGLKLLLGRHYDIQVALDGSKALQVMQSAPCPVVISDMRMPGISGAQFLECVAERWPHAVRIILSGARAFADEARDLRPGLAFRFLSKPCEPKLLRETVAQAFEHYETLFRDPKAPLG
jgi:DNA-binding NtrC family response regulator